MNEKHKHTHNTAQTLRPIERKKKKQIKIFIQSGGPPNTMRIIMNNMVHDWKFIISNTSIGTRFTQSSSSKCVNIGYYMTTSI